jgi:SAM-dependent methyltransferase
MSGLADLYNEGFYADLESGSGESASKILSIVFDLVKVDSVVDFGCGTGAWLREAKRLGAKKLTGLDGPWVSCDQLVDPEIELLTVNLEKEITLARSYDLAISVEVAEHLPECRAESFVRDICSSSAIVLFGAAVPGQGGTNHINEQWQTYWAAKFALNKYLPLDIIRPQIYRDRSIVSWYRNNPILYVSIEEYHRLLSKVLEEKRYPLSGLDFVIPDVYMNPGLRQSLRIASQIPAKIINSIKWRAKIGRRVL